MKLDAFQFAQISHYLMQLESWAESTIERGNKHVRTTPVEFGSVILQITRHLKNAVEINKKLIMECLGEQNAIR